MAVGRNRMTDLTSSDQDYLISCARKKADVYVSKAWLLTAKTLFPHELGIQFEAYEMEKSLKKTKEASKCFSGMFHSFPEDTIIWEEIENITVALRAEQPTPEQVFLKEMFNYLSADIQHQLLLMTASRTKNTMEHCRLMLILLRRFPLSTVEYGNRLMESLTSAEKTNFENQPVNQFRKILVTDLIPLLLKVDLPSKAIFRLLHKAVEFYICYISNNVKQIEGLPDSECKIENPWKGLFELFEVAGKRLGWELCSIFENSWNKDSACQKISQYVHSNRHLLNSDAQMINCRQIVYCTFLLFHNALYEYNGVLNEGDMLMVEMPLEILNDVPAGTSPVGEPSTKKRCRNKVGLDEDTVALTAAHKVSAVRTFTVAFKCYELFHSSETVEKEFYRLIQNLKLDSWVKSIFEDVFLYKGQYDECIDKVQSLEKGLKRNLKLACAFFCKQQYLHMMGCVTSVVEHLSSCDNNSSTNSDSPQSPVSVKPLHKPPVGAKRHLHFLPLKKETVLQYIIKLLIISLKKMEPTLNQLDSDLAVGHMLVLFQLDWPQEEQLYRELIERIKRNRRFTYHLFMKYVINIAFLEDFMYLSTERGSSVTLDIMIPTTNQLLNQRRMSTRGVDKGAKEDFKMAMRRQTGRSCENVANIIMQFITDEKDVIGHCLLKMEIKS